MQYNWEDAMTRDRAEPGRRPQAATPERAAGMGLAQINLKVRDMDRMRNFYRLALNVDARSVRDSAGERSCRCDLGAVTLMLNEAPEDAAAAGGTQTLVFSAGGSEQVDAAWDRLRRAPGVIAEQPPRFVYGNWYEVGVKDPEGNALIFRD